MTSLSRKSQRKCALCASGAPQGPGSVEVGAITFPPQLQTIEDHVADAVDKGARVLVGGQAAHTGARALLSSRPCSSTSTTR